MENIDEFIKQGRERMQEQIDKLRKENPTEPVILEGRPFTPEDFLHLNELNEEILKQNPPEPHQWEKGLLSHRVWEELYFQRPITSGTPSNQKTEE